MSSDMTLDILKRAILLEKRGQSFYSRAALQSESEAVKTFFEMMAAEEDKHVAELSAQYKAYRRDGKFAPHAGEEEFDDVASGVLSEVVQGKISAAGFEAAAVSAAMSMEERAIALYAGRAAQASDEAEKAMYQWLADWEKTHLEMLAKIDRELTEAVWHDNSFWPF